MVYFDTAGYRIVLLTSTPITWCDKVRDRLTAIRGHAGIQDVEQDELRLPAAALLSTSQADILTKNIQRPTVFTTQSRLRADSLCFFFGGCVPRSAHFGTP
jgi:hypothetical protein